MFVTVVIGIMMPRIGRNALFIADLVEQLAAIVDGIMSVISMLFPLFVFGSLFMIVASSDLSSPAAGGKY